MAVRNPWADPVWLLEAPRSQNLQSVSLEQEWPGCVSGRKSPIFFKASTTSPQFPIATGTWGQAVSSLISLWNHNLKLLHVNPTFSLNHRSFISNQMANNPKHLWLFCQHSEFGFHQGTTDLRMSLVISKKLFTLTSDLWKQNKMSP